MNIHIQYSLDICG